MSHSFHCMTYSDTPICILIDNLQQLVTIVHFWFVSDLTPRKYKFVLLLLLMFNLFSEQYSSNIARCNSLLDYDMMIVSSA